MAENEKQDEGKVVGHCPYCEVEIMEASFPFCKSCRVTVLYCPECQTPIPKDSDTCPSCGTKVER